MVCSIGSRGGGSSTSTVMLCRKHDSFVDGQVARGVRADKLKLVWVVCCDGLRFAKDAEQESAHVSVTVMLVIVHCVICCGDRQLLIPE